MHLRGGDTLTATTAIGWPILMAFIGVFALWALIEWAWKQLVHRGVSFLRRRMEKQRG